MKRIIPVFCLILLLLPAFPTSKAGADPPPDFAEWLAALRVQALQEGISPAIFDQALAGIKAPEPKIIASDRNQPELKLGLAEYLGRFVSDRRVETGRQQLVDYRPLLTTIAARYRVQPRFLLAFWGIESDYGRILGAQPILPALVTLAYDQRRGTYFRRELMQGLHILQDRLAPLASLKGSWAGAMGGMQFMPSIYRRYAVDFNGDGQVDIWHDPGDLLATGANYLAASGWQDDQTWGREVRLQQAPKPELLGLDHRLPLSRWQQLGVRRLNGSRLPGRELEASLLCPDPEAGRYFLVYDNFRVILKWNRSDLFALAVGILSDRLVAAEPPPGPDLRTGAGRHNTSQR